VPEETAFFYGGEFDKPQLDSLVQMFAHDGYEQYQRLLNLIQNEDVQRSLGNKDATKIETFFHVQGAFCLLEELKTIPQLTDRALAEIADAEK